MKLVQKLSPKSAGWDRGRIIIAVGKVPSTGGRVLLGRFAGIATDIKQLVNAETGDIQTGLKGSFRALATKPGTDGDANAKPPVPAVASEPGGEEVTSGVCYLPQGIQAMIEGALTEAKATDKNASVRFVLDLFAIPATNKAGYSFDADMVQEAATNDPLADMLAQADGIKALPKPDGGTVAPEKDEAPAAKSK